MYQMAAEMAPKKATKPISESKIEQKGPGLREVLNGIAAGSSGRRRPE
jgi:hypothetical protein